MDQTLTQRRTAHPPVISRSGSDQVRAFPNQREAARMIGVDASTISRDPEVQVERCGRREKRLPPSEVLRLARVYRQRTINDVAQDLVTFAAERAPEHEQEVARQVEAFFDDEAGARAVTDTPSRDEFLAEARRTLPPKLFREVERAYTARDGRRVTSVVGRDPTD